MNSTFYAAPLYEACAYVQPMHSYLTSFKHIMAASTAIDSNARERDWKPIQFARAMLATDAGHE